jgi:hypothetical protein
MRQWRQIVALMSAGVDEEQAAVLVADAAGLLRRTTPNNRST